MLPLAELQSAFAYDLFDGDPPSLAQLLDETSRRRFAIYRNSVFSNYRAALREVYPVVLRLVGEDFFRQAADGYLRSFPSRSGDLNDFGGEFADYLASYPPAAGLYYLPDVARLEWAMERVFHAADSEPLAIAALAEFPQDRWNEIRFALSPAARLIASDYPLIQIWEMNQPGNTQDSTLTLDQAGDNILVIRRSQMVELERLSVGEFVWLSALSGRATLGRALEDAVAQEPAFDLGAALQRHVVCGTLVAARLD